LDGIPGGNLRSSSAGAECAPSALKSRPWRRQNRQAAGQEIALLSAIDDRVHHAVSIEKLSGVGAFWQFPADDLLSHARTSEADQGAGFGEDNVPQIGK
jgi:hypothetical protein